MLSLAAARRAATQRDHGRRLPRGAGWLLLAAYALLLAAWVVGDPPGMAPDEPAHYRKAVALGQGQLLGVPATYRHLPAVTASELDWLNQTARLVRVPAQLRGCDAFRLPLRGQCPFDEFAKLEGPVPAGQQISYVATYPPFAYVLPGLGTRAAQALGWHTEGALVTARAVLALECLLLVGLAGRLLLGPARAPAAGTSARGDPRTAQRRAGLLGLGVALAPMVPFLSATVTGSGPEVCAALAVGAGLLRLTRAEPGAAGRGVWWGTGLAALVLCTARTTGPIWLVLVVALTLALRGRAARGRVVAAVQAAPRAATGAAGLAAVGLVLAFGWHSLVEPTPPSDAALVLGGVLPAVGQLPAVAGQAVGVFGWVDVPLPAVLQALWVVLVAALLGGAARVGGVRERRALALGAGATVLVTVGLSAAVIRPTSPDFEMQGRYVLPILVVLPLLAAEVLRDHPRLVPGRRLVGAGLGVVVAVNAYAWVVNAAHYAGSRSFHAQYPGYWAPAAGWLAWAAVLAVGVLLAVAGILQGLRDPAGPSGQPGLSPYVDDDPGRARVLADA